jgi:hypothetical protein
MPVFGRSLANPRSRVCLKRSLGSVGRIFPLWAPEMLRDYNAPARYPVLESNNS